MKKEIVFIMSYPWYSLYQRPNHLARIFKRHGFRVQVIEYRHIIRLNSLLNKMQFSEHRRDIDRLWSVVKLPFMSLENYQLAGKIKKILAGISPETELTFWLQGFEDSIDYTRLLSLIPGRTILDISDSFPDFFTDIKQRQRLEAAEKMVSEKVDVVLTTAQTLYDKFRKYNSQTFLIRNGVDIARYRVSDLTADPALAKRIRAIGNAKVVGYQGGISAWFDFDLMDNVIKASPDLTFLFAGMVEVRVRREFQRLTRHRNVHYLGVVNPGILPWVLSRIDVGIIPFKIDDLIRATNPIKLYEYFAAGKPVVATPMPEVMRYNARGITSTAESPGAFTQYLREMIVLSSDPALRQERLRLAEENSWEARFRQLLESVTWL
jgi:glycosyltransferase involved in cell wall biosynthesis